MKEATGDLWTYPADYRVITTNGTRRRDDGRAVMGRGCAKEAAQRYPDFPRQLGESLFRHGNVARYFPDFRCFSFPVKWDWDDHADLALIADSTRQFSRHILSSCEYVMPRPGCGNGRLSWADVRPLLLSLPDNVTVITHAT